MHALANAEPDTVRTLDDTLISIKKVREQIVAAEHAVREAHALAVGQGYTLDPVEKFLGLPEKPGQ